MMQEQQCHKQGSNESQRRARGEASPQRCTCASVLLSPARFHSWPMQIRRICRKEAKCSNGQRSENTVFRMRKLAPTDVKATQTKPGARSDIRSPGQRHELEPRTDRLDGAPGHARARRCRSGQQYGLLLLELGEPLQRESANFAQRLQNTSKTRDRNQTTGHAHAAFLDEQVSDKSNKEWAHGAARPHTHNERTEAHLSRAHVQVNLLIRRPVCSSKNEAKCQERPSALTACARKSRQEHPDTFQRCRFQTHL
jgi:hypothetical protein